MDGCRSVSGIIHQATDRQPSAPAGIHGTTDFQPKFIRKREPVFVAGKAKAVQSGADLRDEVAELGASLGLEVDTEVSVGRRVWGARRRIDVVVRHKDTRRSLGMECKYQGTQGSAEEKIAGTIEDIRAWPIRGIVVFSGNGFSPNMRAYLLSTGMAVELPDVKTWLELYFGL